MQTESPAYRIPTGGGVIHDQLEWKDKSQISNRIPFLPNGKASLAVSSAASSLQQSVLKHLIFLYFIPYAADGLNTPWLTKLFPIVIDESCYNQEGAHLSTQSSEKRERLLHAVRNSFEVEPLEDGMDHPAEEIIDSALKTKEDIRVFDWLLDICLDAGNPTLASSVLRCLGRLSCPGTESWRTNLVSRALAIDDAEIRDAAIQAAEYWGGEAIKNALEIHEDPLPWLQDYARDVVEDLRD